MQIIQVKDLGNGVYSWICPRTDFKRDAFLQVLLRAMSNLEGLSLSNRHDLLWQGRKISGSAYRLIRNHGLHHGTMLLQTQLSEISSLLQTTPGYEHAQAMVTSVRSEVANVANGTLSFTTWQQMICRYLNLESILVTEESMEGEPGVRERYAELTSPAWIYRNP